MQAILNSFRDSFTSLSSIITLFALSLAFRGRIICQANNNRGLKPNLITGYLTRISEGAIGFHEKFVIFISIAFHAIDHSIVFLTAKKGK